MNKPGLYMDCNSFGAQAIEMGVKLYGADKILFGTDGTEFGADWSAKAVAEADIGEAARNAILHGNAARVLSHLATFAPLSEAAE
jgi:predicted TIM-barrel fold metal-dependent hydrolase